MKSRFSTIDIAVGIKELRRFFGMRVMNVYDIDNKTYLIRLGKPDDKAMVLLESGIRIHSTEFDWPKNQAPSGFSMKLRKHIRGKRLESVTQLGVDRIIDLQFGSSEAAYHVILELYDKGNIVLADYQYTIINILRPRTDTCQDVKFAVRETYPISVVKDHEIPTVEKLREIVLAAKMGDSLKKVLVPHLDYGPALIEHCLMVAGLPDNVKIGKGFSVTEDMMKLQVAIEEAEMTFEMLQSQPCQGYIIQKKEKRPAAKDGEPAELLTYDEFHPMLFKQFDQKPHTTFENFNKCVDEFFSKQESQKLDMKTLQKEKTALKKLENIKKDHEKRIDVLQKEQETDIRKGQLIEMNLQLVDKAILIVRSAIANQIDWTEISNLVKEAQIQQDPVAMAIKDIKLQSNQITMALRDPYCDSDFDDDAKPEKPVKVDIDLGLSAYANSRRYFDMKKHAAKKEQKTIDASAKALKSAERKTKETLKEVATAASINKARKNYWFEKFLWFITSENFLVIGGRDQQQNEMIVKKYLKPGDLYVHADLHGASSCVIKNHTDDPVPPKTLNEAGSMAICNSAAWDAKVVTSAWWVYHDQVSKTAPSGEYLTTGSFMIRGKKNYLPPSYLVYGFGFIFKLEESSIFRHQGERKIRTTEEDEMSIAESLAAESDITMETENMLDNISDDSDDDVDNDGRLEDEDDQNSMYDKKPLEQNDDDDVKKEEDMMQVVEVKVEDQNDDGGEKTEDQMQIIEVKVQGQDEVEGKGHTSDEEPAFPDTNISLQHVKGDKYELQRSKSSTSDSVEQVEITPTEQIQVKTGARLSAKQRRELRKAKKLQESRVITEDEEDKVSWLSQGKKDVTLTVTADKEDTTQTVADDRLCSQSSDTALQQNSQPQTQAKRGQKGKMKKIKEKYRDQDEEEREQKMEILASAGAKKEDKKKKGKKGQEETKSRPQSTKQQLQQQKRKGQLKGVDVILQPTAEMTLIDADKTTVSSEGTKPTEPSQVQEQHPDSDDEKQEEEKKTQADDMQMIDSLTGIPVSEDELLFAIPVCAPYSALVNFKYKVKLTPGSTKRGKAAKLAINMFQHDKNTTSRERDLIRILKDADTSRNIPGKVKVSAPNLHRKKGK